MDFLKKIEYWKHSILACIHFIKKINLNSNFLNLGEKYKLFIEKINIISLDENFEQNLIITQDKNIVLTAKLLNILNKYETIYNFLKKYVYIFFTPSIIHFLKNQRSYSDSNIIETIYLDIMKNIFLSGVAYIKIQDSITHNQILLDNNKFDRSKCGFLYIMLYLNNVNVNNTKLDRKHKYHILNIKDYNKSSIIVTNIEKNPIHDIQLIQYPIKPIISPDVVNYIEEINNFSIRFPNSKFFTRYNLYPLIDKKYNESTVLTALNVFLVNRLKTIENVYYDVNAKKSNIFGKLFANKFGVKISNNSFLRPAMFHKFSLKNLKSKPSNIENFGGNLSKFSDNNNVENWFPFGGINLYSKKYLTLTENIILEKIKHDDLKIINYFKDDSAQELVKPILYNLDNLFSLLLKEFKIQFQHMIKLLKDDNIKLEYMHLFMLIIGKEYSENSYIAIALKKIHMDKCKQYILEAQIENPHIDIKKFKKELKINQAIILQTNGTDIWNSIKGVFLSKNFESDFNSSVDAVLIKHILIQVKQIFTIVVEQKNTLECIPNSLHLYGIIKR